MKSYREKRIQRVFYLTTALCIYIVICVVWMTIKYAVTSEEETKKGQLVKTERDILAGDIVDCNENVIASADYVEEDDKKEEMQEENASNEQKNKKQKISYRDPYAYSIFIGSTVGKKEKESDADKDIYGLYQLYQSELYKEKSGEDKGATVKTSMDGNLQEYAYELLAAYEKRGAITVLEAKTGKIKACVFTPSYDANTLESGWIDQLAEEGGYIKPLSVPVVPGSIYKIITSMGILENGLEDQVIKDEGTLSLEENLVLNNSGGAAWGPISLEQGFIHSSNVYFGTMGKDYLKKDKMQELAQRCLIGKTLDFDFGRVVSKFEIDDSPSSLAWTAIGQGKVELTVMNAAMIVQAVANDGIMMKPYGVEAIYHGEGENRIYYKQSRAETYKTITTPEVAGRLKEIMKSTGEYYTKNLTGNSTIYAGEKNISIGLKTGTGQITSSGDNHSSWIASMAPADDPEYVVVMNLYDTNRMGKDLLGDVISLYKKIMEKGE